jgi:antitoxin component YwqK of YwqJK toxin-antitoxin module
MNNGRLIAWCLAWLLPLSVIAQDAPAVYFKNYRVVDDTASADFYRVVNSRAAGSFTYTEYHKDGTWVKAIANGTIANPAIIGDEISYYRSGKPAIIKSYHNGGVLSTIGYYPNGILMYVIKPGKVPQGQQLLLYDADSLGNVHVKNGNGERQESDSLRFLAINEHFTMMGPYQDGLKDGLWKGSNDKGWFFEQRYEAGRLVSGSCQTAEGKKYKYSAIISHPEFKGGLNGFEAGIIPALKNVADTAGLQFIKPGYLELGYVIDEHGKLSALHGFKKDGHTPIPLELKKDLSTTQPAKFRGVPTAYTLINNKYVFERSLSVTPFQTDLYLKGTYRSR